MDSLLDKEINIIDNDCFWDEYKLEAMKRAAYTKDSFSFVQESKMGKSFMSFDVNIVVPGRCMKYYMQGQAAKAMAVKWISYCENDSIYWCRSWTGYIVYRAQFIQEGDNYRIIKLLVCNDPEQVDCSYFNHSNKESLIIDFLLLLNPEQAIVPSIKILAFESRMHYLAKKYANDTIEDAKDNSEAVESVIDNFMCGVSWMLRNKDTLTNKGKKEIFETNLSEAEKEFTDEVLKDIEWEETISDEEIQDFKNSLEEDFRIGVFRCIECLDLIQSTEADEVNQIFGDGAFLAALNRIK